MHLSGVWLEEKIEIFYIRQNNIQILISQLTVEWHCENNLYSLRSLFLKKKSKYVYICIGGIFFSISLLRFSKLSASNMYPFYSTGISNTSSTQLFVFKKWYLWNGIKGKWIFSSISSWILSIFSSRIYVLCSNLNCIIFRTRCHLKF